MHVSCELLKNMDFLVLKVRTINIDVITEQGA